jgi:hypothetical protein
MPVRSHPGPGPRHTIAFDAKAVCRGRFVDPTRAADDEFDAVAARLVAAPCGPFADLMDLGTAAPHEVGHVL